MSIGAQAFVWTMTASVRRDPAYARALHWFLTGDPRAEPLREAIMRMQDVTDEGARSDVVLPDEEAA